MAAMGMDRNEAQAAAANAATMSVAYGKNESWLLRGARMTPASPAMKLEMAQAVATTLPEFTPSSCTRRRLSTAPRIWRPRLVNRIRITRATRTATVHTTELRSVPLKGAVKTWK